MKKLTLSLISFALLFILVSCSSKVLVTFDSDGGTECESIEINAGTSISLPKDPEKDGHKFLGWYLDNVKFEASTVINGNITLKAKWEAVKYAINYEIGEGANLAASAVKEFDHGKAAEVKLPKPTKSGFLFIGWYENDVLVETLSENKDYNLVAKWEVAETFEVVLKVEGIVYDTFTSVEGETLAGATLPENPKKEYYKFLGWYLGDNKYDFENTVIVGDLELVAKFQQVELVVAYDTNIPANITAFNANKAEKENKKTEFFDRTQSYIVGDDNNWTFKPEVTFYKFDLDETGAPITSTRVELTPTTWEYEIVIYQYNPATTAFDILVDNTNTDIIDSIDYKTCQINFADVETVEERAFKVKVTPKGLTEKQLENKDDYTVSMNIEVVDGYNAYTALDLAYINDRNDSYKAAWDNFKTANGLLANYVPTRIILQNDISVTTKDVPAEFFYTAEEAAGQKDEIRYWPEGSTAENCEAVIKLEGSLRDYAEIYLRDLSKNVGLTISGNYFKIDSSKMPYVLRENGNVKDLGTVISHATLIKVEGNDNLENEFVLENLQFIGNANRSEVAYKGGGIILTKIQKAKGLVKNNIASQFFITYFPELGTQEVLIEKCKAYDSFNSFIYNWGHKNVVLKDSEMIGAGGPVIIQDHVRPGKADESVPGIKIENCNLQAYVSGTEGWFTLVNATGLVPGIKQLNEFFVHFGHTFLKTSSTDTNVTYMNLILVNKSGEEQTATSVKVSGSTQIINDKTNYTFNYGANNKILSGMLDAILNVSPAGLETSAGGYGYVGQIEGVKDPVLLQPTEDPTSPILLTHPDQLHNAIYQGDYLCIYSTGMAVIVGYEAVETYAA